MNAMKSVTAKTGLDDIVMFNVPTYDDLRFSNVEMNVTMKTHQTKNLLASVSRLGSTQAIQNLAASTVHHYFTTHKIDDRFACEKYGGTINQICHNEMLTQTNRAAADMYAATVRMAQASNNDEAFVKAYADFGKAMLVNQFAFQTALRLAGAGVNVDYKIESTYFSRVMYEFTTTENPEILVPVVNPVNPHLQFNLGMK